MMIMIITNTQFNVSGNFDVALDFMTPLYDDFIVRNLFLSMRATRKALMHLNRRQQCKIARQQESLFVKVTNIEIKHNCLLFSCISCSYVP